MKSLDRSLPAKHESEHARRAMGRRPDRARENDREHQPNWAGDADTATILPFPMHELDSATIAWRLENHLPLVAAQGNRSLLYRAGKRLFDLTVGGLLLILLSPLLLLILVVLTVTTRGKPLFVQERVGYRGQKFRLIKFRSMEIDAEHRQHTVANQAKGPIFKNKHDPRVTRIGKILRRTSLDETPQLLSVLLGSMSLVGPRPPVAKEVIHYHPRQLARLSVKPGLTCLWQVSGRSDLGFEEWMEMDLWYVAHQSLWTDLLLLVRTPWTVLTCRGAY